MNKVCKIGIDARFFGEAGPGRYVKNIVEHLEKVDASSHYVVLLRPSGFDKYTPRNPNFTKVLCDIAWYSWVEQTQLLFQVLKLNLDLYYVPHFNIPVLYPGKLVTAIPDIIMHSYSTERGTTQPKFYFRFKKFVYRKVLGIALTKSVKVIVPTYDVFNDISIHYPNVNKEKFVVAYEGVDPDYTAVVKNPTDIVGELGLKSKQYLLYVSSMYEHKNVERLISAFEILIDKFKFDGKLVLVGKKDKFSERMFTLIKSKGLSNKILMPGLSRYMNDCDVIELRKNALLYVFPSLKEGFSLTPLEAQAVGLPCVISSISCHKEVFENSVVYFDPFSTDDIAAKIQSVLANPELLNTLVSRGYENVKKYNWLDTAKITDQVFNKILHS